MALEPGGVSLQPYHQPSESVPSTQQSGAYCVHAVSGKPQANPTYYVEGETAAVHVDALSIEL